MRSPGERSERCPSGAFAKGENEVSESIEASSGLKRQRCPLRRLRLRKGVVLPRTEFVQYRFNRDCWGVQKDLVFRPGFLAPQVGLEPTTLRLTGALKALFFKASMSFSIQHYSTAIHILLRCFCGCHQVTLSAFMLQFLHLYME